MAHASFSWVAGGTHVLLCYSHIGTRQWLTSQLDLPRNLRPGADWVPSTIVEALFTSSILIRCNSGSDILNSWRPGYPHYPEEIDVEPDLFPDLSRIYRRSHRLRVPRWNQPRPECSTPSELPSSPSSELVAPRYPQRNRKPSDRSLQAGALTGSCLMNVHSLGLIWVIFWGGRKCGIFGEYLWSCMFISCTRLP